MNDLSLNLLFEAIFHWLISLFYDLNVSIKTSKAPSSKPVLDCIEILSKKEKVVAKTPKKEFIPIEAPSYNINPHLIALLRCYGVFWSRTPRLAIVLFELIQRALV